MKFTLSRYSSFRSKQKEEFRSWINQVRNEFDCDTQNGKLKGFEFILLLLAVYGKELIDALIATICSLSKVSSGSSGTITKISDLFSMSPFNANVTWLFILKIIFGLGVMMYLQIRYNTSPVSNLIWILFSFGSIYSILDDIGNHESILRDFFAAIKLIILCGFIFYFFAVDSVHLDSLKVLLLKNLYSDPVSGRIYCTPSTKIDRRKVINLTLWSLYIVFIAMFSVFIASKLFYGSKESDSKPTNQSKLEDMAKKGGLNLVSIIISVIFVAPLIEEWIFRRVLMKTSGFSKWSILASSFIFGLVHLQGSDGLKYIVPYFIPGLIFGISMWISRNIWHTIFAHCCYNLISVIYMIIKMYGIIGRK